MGPHDRLMESHIKEWENETSGGILLSWLKDAGDEKYKATCRVGTLVLVPADSLVRSAAHKSVSFPGSCQQGVEEVSRHLQSAPCKHDLLMHLTHPKRCFLEASK